jgi:hypothetical protein
MSKHEGKTKLVGPWRSLHAAVWLIGLAILAWRDWWWPGILVLIAISALIEAALRQFAPQAYQEVEEETASPAPPAASVPPPAPPVVEHRLELLPSICPNCSGPIRGHEVRWTGAQSADCPYCGSNLPMKVPEQQ